MTTKKLILIPVLGLAITAYCLYSYIQHDENTIHSKEAITVSGILKVRTVCINGIEYVVANGQGTGITPSINETGKAITCAY